TVLGGGTWQVLHQRAIASDSRNLSIEHGPCRRAAIRSRNDANHLALEPSLSDFHSGVDGDVDSYRAVVEQQTVTRHSVEQRARRFHSRGKLLVAHCRERGGRPQPGEVIEVEWIRLGDGALRNEAVRKAVRTV